MEYQQFSVQMADDIAIAYTTANWKEIVDYIFGMAAQGLGEWETIRSETNCSTLYRGKGTPEFVTLMMAWVKGEGIKYMNMMELR